MKNITEIVSRQWNWGDGLSGIRELLLQRIQRIQRIRSAAGAHVEPWKTRIFILIFYPGAAPVLRVLRILRSLRILRFCSRTDLFAHPTPVTSYLKSKIIINRYEEQSLFRKRNVLRNAIGARRVF